MSEERRIPKPTILNEQQDKPRPLLVIGPGNLLKLPKNRATLSSTRKRCPLLSRPRIYAVPDKARNCHRGSFCETQLINQKSNESSESHVLQLSHTKSVSDLEIIRESSSLERKLITTPNTLRDLWDGPSGKTGTVKRKPAKITINLDHDIPTNNKQHNQNHPVNDGPKPETNFDSFSHRNEYFTRKPTSFFRPEITPKQPISKEKSISTRFEKTSLQKRTTTPLASRLSPTGNRTTRVFCLKHEEKLKTRKKIGIVGPMIPKKIQSQSLNLPIFNHTSAPLQLNENAELTLTSSLAPGSAISNMNENLIPNSFQDVNPSKMRIQVEPLPLEKSSNCNTIKKTEENKDPPGDFDVDVGNANSILDASPPLITSNEETHSVGQNEHVIQSAFSKNHPRNDTTHAKYSSRINNTFLMVSDLLGCHPLSDPYLGNQSNEIGAENIIPQSSISFRTMSTIPEFDTQNGVLTLGQFLQLEEFHVEKVS